MKMKFSTIDGRVVMMRVDQKVARKCYENSLYNRRGTYAFLSAAKTNNLQTDVE